MIAPKGGVAAASVRRDGRRTLAGALAMGTLAFASVIATLGGPGITCDEPLDVRPGTTYVAAIKRLGSGFFTPSAVDRVFRDNAEHPPLGRWFLGVAATLGAPFESSWFGGADPFDVHAGRLAPAAAFGLLIALVVHATASRRGLVAGIAAGYALFVMPRVWSHAHLGALDTFLACFFTAALVSSEAASRVAGRSRRAPAPASSGGSQFW